MAVKKMPIAKLVEDMSFYPRNAVDDTHVADLVRAIRAEVKVPPIVVEASTLRIVDGVHRRRALMKVLGGSVEYAVDLRSYANDAELFIDAVKLNASHGRKLDRQDQARVVLRLQELQVDEKTIAATLHVPASQVQRLSVRVVYDTGGGIVPSKRGFEHLRGHTLSDDQIAVMGDVRSGEAGRLCIELTKMLAAGLVNLNDQEIRGRLQSLAGTIQEALKLAA